jgi:hypothetical protein
MAPKGMEKEVSVDTWVWLFRGNSEPHLGGNQGNARAAREGPC